MPPQHHQEHQQQHEQQQQESSTSSWIIRALSCHTLSCTTTSSRASLSLELSPSSVEYEAVQANMAKMKLVRRVSTGRRRLGSTDSQGNNNLNNSSDTSLLSPDSVSKRSFRSRSQERRLKHGDSEADRSSLGSSTAGSDRDLDFLEEDPLDQPHGTPIKKKAATIATGTFTPVKSNSSGASGVASVTATPAATPATPATPNSNNKKSSSSKRPSSSPRYHRRATSDPFDISGIEVVEDQGDATETDAATVDLVVDEQAATLPTLPRFPVAETRDLNCWSEPPINIFKVRSQNYLTTKRKTQSSPYLMDARGCDLLLFPEQDANKGQPVHVLERRNALLNGTLPSSPTLIINFRFPWGLLMLHFEIPKKIVPFLHKVPKEQWYQGEEPQPQTTDSKLPDLDSLSPGERTLAQWIMGDTKYKNQRLKLIPYVVQGPWVVRNLVTGKPAIIGTKLPVSYSVKDSTLVAELDIGNSSATAKRIVSICRRYMNALTCDIGFVIQGNTQQELPEQMLGAIRIHGVDPLKAPTFG